MEVLTVTSRAIMETFSSAGYRAVEEDNIHSQGEAAQSTVTDALKLQYSMILHCDLSVNVYE